MRNRLILLVLFGVVSILLVGGVGYIIFSSRSNVSKPNVISERGREFLKEQKLSDSTLWRNVVLDKKVDEAGQTISLDNCFSLTIPFVIKRVTSEEGCVGIITLSSGGNIAIGRRVVAAPDVSESPDVKLRRSKPAEYSETGPSDLTSNFLVFGRVDAGYEKVGFLQKNDIYLTVSLVSSTNENLDEQFYKLLASIRLL